MTSPALGRRPFLKLGLSAAGAMSGALGPAWGAGPGPGDFHHPNWGRVHTREFQAWRKAANHPDRVFPAARHDGVIDNNGLVIASGIRTRTRRTGYEHGPGTVYKVRVVMRKESRNLTGWIDFINPYDGKRLRRVSATSPERGWGPWVTEEFELTSPNTGLTVLLRNDSNTRGNRFDLLIHTLDIDPWPFGDTPPPPRRIQKPMWWTQELTAGVSWSWDFGPCFRGGNGRAPVTGYVYEGPEPHAWEGSRLTLTPTLATEGPEPREVWARSPVGRSDAPATFSMQVHPSAAPLTPRGAPPRFLCEPGRGAPVVQAEDFVEGGARPLVFTPEGEAPAWIRREHNGLFWGKVPKDASGLQTARIRATDQRGESVVVEAQWEVGETWDRTPTLTLEPGTHEAPTEITYELLAEHRRSGGVVFLPDGVYLWRIGSNICDVPHDQVPMIIRGGPGALIETGISIDDGTRGLLVEGLTARMLHRHKTWRNACYTSGCERVLMNDLTVEVQPWRATPGDGRNWKNNETERYGALCYDLRGGTYVVLDNCLGQKGAEIFVPRGTGTMGLYDCRTDYVADDHGLTAEAHNKVISGFVTGRFKGNYVGTQHRDLWQSWGDNKPVPWRVVYDGCFLSGRGDNVTQGHFTSWHRWGARGAGLDEALYQQVLRDCVILSGASTHGLTLERWADSKVERVLIAGHPDAREVSKIFVRKPSHLVFDGVIHQGYIDDYGAPHFRHLLGLGKLGWLDLSRKDAPSIETIFPNWRRKDLPDEERVMMSADWHRANPGMGPRICWPEEG